MDEHLRDEGKIVNGGNLKRAEAMLICQATALQAIFAKLVEAGMQQKTMPMLESYMKLALRAQSQCRATLETLAVTKNPPVVVAKQANIANGPQQINNGVETPRTENEKRQNQLLEVKHEQWLDTRTTTAASGTNQELATVGKVNRPQNTRR